MNVDFELAKFQLVTAQGTYIKRTKIIVPIGHWWWKRKIETLIREDVSFDTRRGDSTPLPGTEQHAVYQYTAEYALSKGLYYTDLGVEHILLTTQQHPEIILPTSVVTYKFNSDIIVPTAVVSFQCVYAGTTYRYDKVRTQLCFTSATHAAQFITRHMPQATEMNCLPA